LNKLDIQSGPFGVTDIIFGLTLNLKTVLHSFVSMSDSQAIVCNCISTEQNICVFTHSFMFKIAVEASCFALSLIGLHENGHWKDQHIRRNGLLFAFPLLLLSAEGKQNLRHYRPIRCHKRFCVFILDMNAFTTLV